MSARPAFTSARAHTSFAGGISPWTHKPAMPAKSASSPSPFPTAPRAPRKSTVPRIDTSKLKIRSDIPLPTKRGTPPGKYDAFFKDLQPKQCVECKPDEVSPISQALRKYLRDHRPDAKLTIVVQQHTDENPNLGRVWLWPAEEVTGVAAKRPRGVAADHKSPATKAKA